MTFTIAILNGVALGTMAFAILWVILRTRELERKHE